MNCETNIKNLKHMLKQIKIQTYILMGTLAILAGSCIPSLFPLYTLDDIVHDNRIEGKWDGGENGIWIIERLEYHPGSSFLNPDWTEPEEDSDSLNIHYRLTVKEFENGDTAEAEFLLHLLQLEDQLYANFYPQEFELHHDFLSWHMIEANNFSKISISDDMLEFEFFAPDFLMQLIDENRIRISHVSLGEDILLTAPTKDLQKFVIKYGNEKDAILSPDVFRRI